MPLRTPDTKQEQDKAHNPFEQDYERKFSHDSHRSTVANDLQQLENYANNEGVDEIERYANDPKNATGNIDTTRQREQTAGNTASLEGPWRNNTSAAKGEPVSEEDFEHKKGPIAVITALLFGGGGLIALFTAPGIGVVHFTETLFNDLDDRATALDMRATKMISSRIKADRTSGICLGKINIGCRMKRAGSNYIENLKRAGAEVTCSNGDCTNKFNNKIKSIKFPDGSVLDDASKLRSLMISNPEARSVMLRGYNPVFMSVWDSTAAKWFQKMGITKAPIKSTGDKEKDKEKMRKAGDIPAKDGKPLIPKHDDPNDPNKITGYEDTDGKVYTPEEGRAINEGVEDIASKLTGGAASKIAHGAIGTVGLIGDADSACTFIKGMELISMGAKTVRTAEAVLAGSQIPNVAGQIIAGKGEVSVAQAAGEMLTETNTQKKAIDDNGNTIDNPDYGKSAFDSLGYKASAGFLKGQPKLSSMDSRFMVGTPLTGVLDTLSRLARNVVNPSACGVIQNPFVRAGNVIAGIAVAFFTGGASTVKMAAQGAFAITVSVGMAYIEAQLQDLASGNISEDFKDVGVGNVSFVGVSEMNQRIGGGSGMGYQTKDNMDEFNSLRAEFNDRYVADQKYEASKDPFNPYLQYSFTGSIARQLLPLQYADSTSERLSILGSLPVHAFQSLFNPAAMALNIKPYNPERFNVCRDETYLELNIKADIFCNLRRAMTKEELNMDPEENADWMVSNGYVDGEAEATQGDVSSLAKGDYQKFLQYCVDKADVPPGINPEEGGEENWATQKNCIDPVDISKDTLSHFRVFTLDYSVMDGMDNGAQSIGANASGSSNPGGSGQLVTGEAKDLARKLANNENIIFVKPATKTALEAFADTGKAINACGDPFTIDPMLPGVMLALSSKYRVFVGNLGFQSDRNVPEDCVKRTSQHLFGRAVDLNGIEQIGGGKTSWGSIRFTSSEVPVIQNYANDWLEALPPDRGGVGQKGCGGFTITPPADAVKVNGSLFFTDSCNHLHIDVRQR